MSVIRRLPLLSLAPLMLTAHMVSISTGELRVEETLARYELKAPLYEVEGMDAPQQTLFEHFKLRSGGVSGRLKEVSCAEDRSQDSYVCSAEYEFPAPIEILEVECTFYAVTVPNHVHVLRARKGETVIQEVFDFTASRVDINFIPPSAWDIAKLQVGSGARRAAGGLASLLFLFALVIAARRRQELLALAGMFLAGQVAVCLFMPLINWYPAPRFVEAAAALTIAYLAVEVLLLPEAGQRWLVVGVLGLFHGLYLELFLRQTMFSPFYVLPGAFATELGIIALLALVWSRARPRLEGIRPEKVAAVLLLAFGLSWFFLRIQG